MSPTNFEALSSPGVEGSARTAPCPVVVWAEVSKDQGPDVDEQMVRLEGMTLLGVGLQDEWQSPKTK